MEHRIRVKNSQEHRKHKRYVETNQRADIKERRRHLGGRRRSRTTCSYAGPNSSFTNDLSGQGGVGTLVPSPIRILAMIGRGDGCERFREKEKRN
uniref:Uncharacterized protein n=1 Tax=Cucumis melo TaxID=3656 RepID=A0A9I9CXS6_CUCME